MPIAKESGNFTPVPAGTYAARCVQCISLGTQPQNDPKFSPCFKVMLRWEVPSETVELDGKPVPMIAEKEYSLFLSEKARLRADLVGWRGREFTPEELKGFEVSNVLDKTCMISVIHKKSARGSTYAAITAISKLPKGMECGPRVHPLLRYEIEQGTSCPEWLLLAEWIQAKIKLCSEWTNPAIDREEVTPAHPLPGSPEALIEVAAEDDVPF